MKKITNKLHTLLLNSCNATSSYEPEDCLSLIEEYLDSNEYDTVYGFLCWIVENNRTFGHDVPEVFGEFMAKAGDAYIENAKVNRLAAMSQQQTPELIAVHHLPGHGVFAEVAPPIRRLRD